MALVKRAVVSFVAALIAFYLTAWLLPGQLQVMSLAGGIAAVLLIAALNLPVRPILIALAAGRSLADDSMSLLETVRKMGVAGDVDVVREGVRLLGSAARAAALDCAPRARAARLQSPAGRRPRDSRRALS